MIKENIYDRLKEMEKWATKGKNNFTMDRGSFKYTRSMKQRAELKRIAFREAENSFEIEFMEPKNSLRLMVSVSRDEGGLITVRFTEMQNLEGWNRFWIGFMNPLGEHVYGCGETYSKFDLKGERIVRIFVAEHQNAKRIGKKIVLQKLFGKFPGKTMPFDRYESYYAQPTFVSSKKYFMHADSKQFSEFDFMAPGQIKLYLQELPALYFYQGESYEDISYKLSELLGRQRELPDWVYDGAILGIQQGPEVIDEKINKALAAGAKVCGVWSQDWCGCRRTDFGYQVMWNWEQDRELYPDLKEKIAQWKSRSWP